MNETIKNILSRRSIRDFTEEKLNDEQIKVLIECALSSPTAKNMQEWYFVFIQDNEIRKLLPKNCFNAPLIIMIFGESNEHYTPIDCGIACENIVIAAKSLGLDTCIVGSIRNKIPEEVLEKITVPENYEFVISISVGYANGLPMAKINQENKYEIL